MLPIFYKQLNDRNQLAAPRKVLLMYIKKNVEVHLQEDGINMINMVEKSITDTVNSKKGDGNGDASAKVEENENTDPLSEVEGNADIVPEGKDNTDTLTEGKTNTDILSEGERNTDTADNEKGDENQSEDKQDLEFLKIFGSIKEVNEFLDLESEYCLCLVFSTVDSYFLSLSANPFGHVCV